MICAWRDVVEVGSTTWRYLEVLERDGFEPTAVVPEGGGQYHITWGVKSPSMAQRDDASREAVS